MITHAIPALKLRSDDVFRHIFRFGMRHRFVKMGTKHLSHCRNRFYTVPRQNVVIRVPRLRHCTVHPLTDHCAANMSYLRALIDVAVKENPEIPVAQSLVDYLFRWLASQFLSEDEKEQFGVLSPAVKAKLMEQEYGTPKSKTNGNGSAYANTTQTDAPPCANCGWIMTRAGTCYRCDNCGTTTGCG